MQSSISGRIATFIIAILLATSAVVAQKLTWSVDFRTVFDNREGDRAYVEPRTFFQTRFAPEIGIAFGEELQHRLSGGVVWTQPIGEAFDGYRLALTLYYRYEQPSVKFSFGMFPRRQLIEPMADFLWSDSLNYRYANIRGAMLQIVRPQGFFEAFIDWRGIQSPRVREAFSIQGHGSWTPGPAWLMVGGTGMLNHLAKTTNPGPEEGVVDNIVFNTWMGVNLSSYTPLDSLTIKAGPLVAFDRYRLAGDWKIPVGVRIDAALQWHRFGVRNITYLGKPLFPFYKDYGALLDQGEPYYTSTHYNSTRCTYKFIKSRIVELEGMLDFKFAHSAFDFYQVLKLKVFVGQL